MESIDSYLAFEFDLLFILDQQGLDKADLRGRTAHAIRGVPFRQTGFASVANTYW